MSLSPYPLSQDLKNQEHLDYHPLNFIQCDLVAQSGVKLGCSGALVRCDASGIFQCTAAAKVGRDAGRTKRVAANAVRQSDIAGVPLSETQGVVRMQPMRSQFAAAVQRSEERTVSVAGNTGTVKVGVHVLLGLVVGGYFVELAALLVQSNPPSLSVLVVVGDVHAHDCSDARETEDQDADQCPVPEAADRTRVDGIEKLPAFLSGQDRRLPFLHDVLWASHRCRGIHRQHVAENQVIEEHPQCRERLLHRGLAHPLT